MDTYVTLYAFGFHLENVSSLLLVTLMFAICNLAFCGYQKEVQRRPSLRIEQEKKLWSIATLISGLTTLSIWGAYIPDYMYYNSIYQQHQYQIVQGAIQRVESEPDNSEALQVGEIVFHNSPRQITSAFQNHSRIFNQIDRSSQVRVYYTQDYWRPSEQAILRIDVLAPEQ
jgi:hypothetical protein